ncbi:L,D-transpeptidase family protein [Nguyenibacter sp. L1]|uniref:L,D-transpeptidase family protein n=1 Tax=Nguyenibacter sp. L1 TaxID=3049350 RepID=UPI002B476515|nr:L,D-transpeptidase family protein [Nguyenibacter sp. L1]WRH88120.1 L,D-transpeptidase family protein [Nguyenibacter sp. L1]
MIRAVLETHTGADARLRCRGELVPAAIGAGGIRILKQEGDLATPSGVLPLRRVLYRADRVAPPACALPVEPLAPHDGWCDDPTHPDYNRPVTLPHPARHERMWRDDDVYNIVIVLGYNDSPPVRGRGSAIFLHLQAPDGRPTEGCIALRESDLRRLLAAGLTEIAVPEIDLPIGT